MNINILHLIEGARQAKGLTVIIDVFRAFSTACYAFGSGAEKIIPVGNIDIARELKNENPDYILMGERGAKKPEDFDYGNSPAQNENADFKGKTIIHTTSSGTQGIANAEGADEIITGSIVNVQAVINYIRQNSPDEVSIVAMGDGGVEIADEDELCAEYIKNALEGKPNDFNDIVNHLRTYKSARKFFDPLKDWAPEKDFDLCLSLNKFNFVLKAEKFIDNHVYLSTIKP